jgi:hypothetical protein
VPRQRTITTDRGRPVVSKLKFPECASEFVTTTVSRPMRGPHPSWVLLSTLEWLPDVSGGSLHPTAGTTRTLKSSS